MKNWRTFARGLPAAAAIALALSACGNASDPPPYDPIIEMVAVAGGAFDRGGHMVTVSPFRIGRFPVTQGQWETVMGANPSRFTAQLGRPAAAGESESDRPVERVSWHDALVFANRLSIREGLRPAYEIRAEQGGAWTSDPGRWGAVPNAADERWDSARIAARSDGYRLPSEAQWEFAARGGGEEGGAWTAANSGNMTRAVGQLAANGLGLHDMGGNVHEWTWDRRGEFPDAPQTDPVGPEVGNTRVFRGGSWSGSEEGARPENRGDLVPAGRAANVGLRLARP